MRWDSIPYLMHNYGLIFNISIIFPFLCLGNTVVLFCDPQKVNGVVRGITVMSAANTVLDQIAVITAPILSVANISTVTFSWYLVLEICV